MLVERISLRHENSDKTELRFRIRPFFCVEFVGQTDAVTYLIVQKN